MGVKAAYLGFKVLSGQRRLVRLAGWETSEVEACKAACERLVAVALTFPCEAHPAFPSWSSKGYAMP